VYRKLYFILIITFISLVTAQNPECAGCMGLFHTHTGRLFRPGWLGAYTNMNLYYQHPKYIDPSSASGTEIKDLWLLAGNIAVTCGIIENLDVTAALRVYQDTYYLPKKSNSPDDLFLTCKAGSFTFGEKRFYAAFMASTRIATGSYHNYPYAEFASGSFEYGLSTAISYYRDPYFLDESFNFHFNIGLWNHNEKGNEIELINDEKRKYSVNSLHLQMAVAAVFPSESFEYRFELSGIRYFTIPDPWVLSAEEWAFFTPSLRYKISGAVSADFGIDIRLVSGNNQWTEDGPDNSNIFNLPKNFPLWKAQLGLWFHILPISKKKIHYIDTKNDRELEEQIKFYLILKEEKLRAKKLDSEFNSLRSERRSADEEIDEVRDELEE
jgi:hypothetical protein